VRFPTAAPQPGAARRHLADRSGPGDQAPRRRGGAGPAPVGVPASETERRAGNQLPLGGPPVSGRAVPGAGVAFLRIHRDPIAERQVEVHQVRRGVVLLRRVVAADARRIRAGIHAADRRTRPRCRADPDRQMAILERDEWLASSISAVPSANCLSRCRLPAWRWSRFADTSARLLQTGRFGVDCRQTRQERGGNCRCCHQRKTN